MGAWGPGLYSDDVTEDVRGIYVDKLHRGKNGEQASKEMNGLGVMKMMLQYFGLQWQICSGIMGDYRKKSKRRHCIILMI